MELKESIIRILKKTPGLTAKEIASKLNIQRTPVNSVLYRFENVQFFKGSAYRWYLSAEEATSSQSSQIPKTVSEIISRLRKMYQELVISNPSFFYKDPTFGYDSLVDHNHDFESDILRFILLCVFSKYEKDYKVTKSIFDEINKKLNDVLEFRSGFLELTITRIDYTDPIMPKILYQLRKYDKDKGTKFEQEFIQLFTFLGIRVSSIFASTNTAYLVYILKMNREFTE